MKELEPVTISKNNSYTFSSFFLFNFYVQNIFFLFHFDFFLDSRVVPEHFVIILSSVSFTLCFLLPLLCGNCCVLFFTMV